MSVRVLHGDCFEVLPTLEAESVHAVITDPPAGISFMGKAWDDDKGGRDQWIVWMQQVAAECLRVIKPGGHALVWALPRTSHWTATAWENAGWSVRDKVLHIFASGFPKSLDISKAMDRTAGVEREVVGPRVFADGTSPRATAKNFGVGDLDKRNPLHGLETLPSTPGAIQWAGWGTALKPACEDWWLLRKPLSEPTVAANTLRHGCGGLNIDASRVETEDAVTIKQMNSKAFGYFRDSEEDNTGYTVRESQGRWPANVVLSKPEEEYILRPDTTAEQRQELYRWLSENT